MASFLTNVRVRYSETDQAGFVYYGNYAQYFEVARVEAFRKIGLTYRSIEERGIIMPVLSMSIKYHKPAHYDDLLTIETELRELPAFRIQFFHKIYNEDHNVINTAEITLAFISSETYKPVHAPPWLINAVRKYV